MYAMFQNVHALEVWKKLYCNTPRHTKCARYEMALQGETAPANLLPNGKEITVTGK